MRFKNIQENKNYLIQVILSYKCVVIKVDTRILTM